MDARELLIILMVGGLVAGLVGYATIYATYRAFKNGDWVWGVGILLGWLASLGWLMGLIYLLIVDRQRRMSGVASTPGRSVPRASSGEASRGDEATGSWGPHAAPPGGKARMAIGITVFVLGTCVVGTAMLLEFGRSFAESSADLSYILLQIVLVSVGAAGIGGGARILWRRSS